jgi:hypothetical protein
MLLRFQQAQTQSDRIKLALAYMENVAPLVDEAMKGAVEHEGTTIIVTTSNRGKATAQ